VRKKYTVIAGNHTIKLGETTKVMGIINITPDSFSQDGCLKNKKDGIKKAIALARKMIRQGADILDIGGESTRPGSKRVPLEEELKRVIPVIKAIAKTVQVPVSIDTYKSTVAKHALDAGATIVNNIKGVRSEKSLLRMVRDYNAAIVLMHIQNNPSNMQKNVSYKNIIGNIYTSLRKSIENCLEIGIKSDRIIIDPGIGFGKTVENNLEIINRLSEFCRLKKPILIGTSRKSFIGQILNNVVTERLIGTAASVSASILKGAHIVRVHDVKEMSETARLTDAILNESF